MTESQRHRSIVELVNTKQVVTVGEIVDLFSISAATARRDLTKLAARNQLERIRSGAKSLPLSGTEAGLKPSSRIEELSALRTPQEKEMALKAVSLLNEGDSITMNSEEASVLLAKAICHQPYSVTTNYFPLAQYLIDKGHEQLVVPGGQYLKENATFISSLDSLTDSVCTDRMFLCADGLTGNGFFRSDIITGLGDKQLAPVADRITVIFRNGCLEHSVGSCVTGFEKVDSVILPQGTKPSVLEMLRQKKIKVFEV